MTDKEKVLAKFPGAFAYYSGSRVMWRIVGDYPYTPILGSGPTESEAWANAVKGLDNLP